MGTLELQHADGSIQTDVFLLNQQDVYVDSCEASRDCESDYDGATSEPGAVGCDDL